MNKKEQIPVIIGGGGGGSSSSFEVMDATTMTTLAQAWFVSIYSSTETEDLG